MIILMFITSSQLANLLCVSLPHMPIDIDHACVITLIPFVLVGFS